MFVVASSCTKDEVKVIEDNNSYDSKSNIWQSHRFVAGAQTGTFTVDCDIVTEKDSIDAIFGMQSNVASTYSDVSSLIRFNSSSYIDVYNGLEYAISGDTVTYTKATNYHLRLEVDLPNLKYNVYVTPNGMDEVRVAEEFNLYNFAVFIDQWSTISTSTDGLTVSNIKVSEHTVNKVPVVLPTGVIRSAVDVNGNTIITAVDPLSGSLTMETIGLPDFATSVDNGDGTITISYKSSLENIGVYNFKVKASSSSSSSEEEFEMSVTRNSIVVADALDSSANSDGTVDWAGRTQMWIGGQSGYDMAAVIPVRIPAIQEGETLSFATLDINIEFVTDWAWQDYDLYGLPFRSSPTVLATDHWQGDYGTDANAFALQQKLFSQASEVSKITTSEEAGTLIAEYINTQISNGAKEGDYVFFRINVNVVDAPDYGKSYISSANAADDNAKPKVELFFTK